MARHHVVWMTMIWLVVIVDARQPLQIGLFSSCFRLRGGASVQMLQKEGQQQQATGTTVEEIEPQELKPQLRRGESVLVLPDLKVMHFQCS
jgi:hypothetical protein